MAYEASCRTDKEMDCLSCGSPLAGDNDSRICYKCGCYRYQAGELIRALETIEDWVDDGASRAEGLDLAFSVGGLRTASGVFRAIRSKARAALARYKGGGEEVGE